MRKMKLFLMAVIVGTFLAVCDPDNNNGSSGGGYDGGGSSGGGTVTTGTLKLTNVTSYPFKVYINNAYKETVYGGATYSYKNEAGNYKYKIEQTSGHYQYPLIEEKNVYIYANNTQSYNIPTVTTGKIKLVSESDNPYTVFINGSNEGTLNGNSSKTYTVDAWHSYNVEVVQQSGYIFYPSEYSWTVKVDAQYIYTCTFPYKSESGESEGGNDGQIELEEFLQEKR